MIVDDEKLALSRLSRVLSDEGISEISTFLDGFEALEEIKKSSVDVVFLDINMPNINGLELANKIIEIDPKVFIIFQTAYSEYALDAFQSGGMDYLLKPVESEQIKKCLERVKLFLKDKDNISKKIIGKRGNNLHLINLDDIYYIKADLDEVIIRIKESDVYVRKKIGDLQNILAGKNFFRIHRSCIVNVDKIKSMKSVEQSKLQISFTGIDEVVTSSKDGAKEFREYLEKISI